MNEELAIIDVPSELAIRRPPEVVLDEAMRAAKVLKQVLDNKTRKVVFNGQQYIENEDWLTIARFYGLTAKITDCQYVQEGDAWGYKACAVALTADCREVSEAFASCFSDEPNWRNKPRFQLESMAQTRACSKALRNVLAFVPVLAGYRPTPAEEMDGMAQSVETTPALWTGPGQCPSCHCPEGKKHSSKCKYVPPAVEPLDAPKAAEPIQTRSNGQNAPAKQETAEKPTSGTIAHHQNWATEDLEHRGTWLQDFITFQQTFAGRFGLELSEDREFVLFVLRRMFPKKRITSRKQLLPEELAEAREMLVRWQSEWIESAKSKWATLQREKQGQDYQEAEG